MYLLTYLLKLSLLHCVRQITVRNIAGPKPDKFLRKVQQAAAGPPWNMVSPRVVGYIIYYNTHCVHKKKTCVFYITKVVLKFPSNLTSCFIDLTV